MTRNVEAVIDQVLAFEGGVVDLGDGKGMTRYGQTQAWLDDHGFVPPSSPADAAANYATWMERVGLAAICDIDVFLGQLVTDFAVHAGERVAFKVLQAAAGAPADGLIGPMTLAAVRKADVGHLQRRVLAERIRYTGALLGSKNTDRRVWAAGWCRRLADQVEALP